MKHWYQQPHPSISGYVRTVLVVEGFAEPAPNELPLVTSGMPAFFCKSEKGVDTNELKLFGKSIPEEEIIINDNTTIIAYFFKPFALATIFNIFATRLAKDPVELSNWYQQKINALKTQLIYADTTSRKIEVLDNLLIHQLEQNKRDCEIIKCATDEIMYDPGTAILSEMLSKLNLTERTFQRIFKKYVGVTPNQYRRICQFHLSFMQLRSKDFNKLTDIAYDNGFADQSHFIRSFKEFAQTTPNDYLRAGLKDKNE